MASIKLILRINKIDQSGHSPLYIRLIKDRKTKFVAVGVKLKENEWDDEKQRVKKNHPNSARMNASISQKVADAEAQVADLERKVKSVSANKLKEAIKGKEIPNFFQFSYKRCENIRGSVSISTYRNYVMYLKKFEDWVGTNNLHFDEITVTLLKDYLAYMSNTLKNGNTTQRYSIMILAIMFKEAIKEDIIPEFMYPFSKLNLKKDPTKRMFLNKDQIEALSKLELKDKSELARDLFIFAIYAGGLRYSDVIELQYKHFNSDENRIKKTIRKTKREHQFKIGNTALGILNKYFKSNADKEDFIFPVVVDKKKFLEDEEFRYDYIESSNHSNNFQLNRLGKQIELPFSLSFHLSRHSFATTALNNGMRIEHVSKLMDHSDIRTTQIYAKILNEELDKAVDQFID
jgi:site-specific recombinase XerD